MKNIEISNSGMKASAIVQGCMRLKGKTVAEVEEIILKDLELGINYFDHADVYGTAGMRGECETLFGDVLSRNKNWREHMYLQSKCGICKEGKGYYDFSKKHIIEATEGILNRLQVEYLDTLLLHRPDTLVEPEKVAEAFEELEKSGKVRYFGVSNMNPLQVELLRRNVKQPIIINQMQFSIAHSLLVGSGMSVNNRLEQSIDYSGSSLEYARLHNITIQAWSPFQKGFFEGTFIGDNKHYGELNKVLLQIGEKYNLSKNAVAAAWILRHPANMQVILGTTNLKRIQEACAGVEVKLTRKEWYEVYCATGNKIL